MCNKRIISLIVVLAFLSTFVAMFVIDSKQLANFEKPIFCIETNSLEDDGAGEFKGLGYHFSVVFEEESHLPKEYPVPIITAYKQYLCGKEITCQRAGLQYKLTKGVVSDIENIEGESFPYVLHVDDGLGENVKYMIYSSTEFIDMDPSNLEVGMKVEVFSEYYPVTISDETYPALEVVLNE